MFRKHFFLCWQDKDFLYPGFSCLCKVRWHEIIDAFSKKLVQLQSKSPLDSYLVSLKILKWLLFFILALINFCHSILGVQPLRIHA